MVIEMDYREYRKRLEAKRLWLSIFVGVTVAPLLFDPIELNLTLLALAVNAVVWLSWLISTIGQIHELNHIAEERALERPPRKRDTAN